MTLPPDLEAAIDRFAEEHGVSRERAIDLIIRDWLIGHGILPAEAADED